MPDFHEGIAAIVNSESELPGFLRMDDERIWAITQIGMALAGMLDLPGHLFTAIDHAAPAMEEYRAASGSSGMGATCINAASFPRARL